MTGIVPTGTTAAQPTMLATAWTNIHPPTKTALFRGQHQKQQQHLPGAFSVRLPMMVAALLLLLFGVIEPCACSRSNGNSSSSLGPTVGGTNGGVPATSAAVYGMQNVTHDDGGLINCAVRNAVGACQPADDGAGGHRSSGRRAKVLSRNKRYVAFPEGSSFSVAFCATLGFVGNPSFIYFSWAINWGLAYELPNQTWILSNQEFRKPLPPPAVVLRRQRRELYGRLETAIDSMGYDGRQCILRALCESTQYFFMRGSNMVEELLRTVFSLPKSRVLSFEHTDLVEYDAAHRRGQQRVACAAAYPLCGMSLIEMALGEYSKQPPPIYNM